MKKTLTVVCALLAMMLLLTACGGSGAPSIEGTWELVDATTESGGEDFATAMAQLKEMGGSVTLTFKGGKMTMAMEVMGQSQTQEADYEYKDGKLITDGTTLDVKIDGDKLTLTDGTNSMTLQKKK